MSLITYALEKYSEAVVTLATHPGRVQERLQQAWVALIFVPVTSLPEELQQAHNEIYHQAAGETPFEGSLGHYIPKLSDTDASAMATEIVDIYFQLTDFHRNS